MSPISISQPFKRETPMKKTLLPLYLLNSVNIEDGQYHLHYRTTIYAEQTVQLIPHIMVLHKYFCFKVFLILILNYLHFSTYQRWGLKIDAIYAYQSWVNKNVINNLNMQYKPYSSKIQLATFSYLVHSMRCTSICIAVHLWKHWTTLCLHQSQHIRKTLTVFTSYMFMPFIFMQYKLA